MSRSCGRSSTGSPPAPPVALDVVDDAAGVAATLESWSRQGAVDGFVIQPDVLPTSLDWLAAEVMPRLGVPPSTGHAARALRTPPPAQPLRHRRGCPVTRRKQIHLAAHFPGVNNTTVWSDPDSGSQTDFSSFVHLAQTAERGKFDFFFLAEGLRLREHRGRIFDLDVVGRPDSLTVLAALAAVTDHIGLAATLNTTFNEPFELARQFATLDHLSNGRAAWNAVTSPDAFTGENFRRGGFLERDDRYGRAAEFVEAARLLWDTWSDDAVVADTDAGVLVDPDAVAPFRHVGPQFSIEGRFDVPRSPQGYP